MYIYQSQNLMNKNQITMLLTLLKGLSLQIKFLSYEIGHNKIH